MLPQRATSSVPVVCSCLAVCIAVFQGTITESCVKQSAVFISHGHMDHCGAIPMHAARRQLLGMGTATYYVPLCMVDHVEGILRAFRALTDSALPAHVQGVSPGDLVLLNGSGSGVYFAADCAGGADSKLGSSCKYVTAWPTAHRVPSNGYILWDKRMTLKADHRGKSSKEIGLLRQSLPPSEMFDVEHIPLIAVTGDTTIEGVLSCEPALQVCLPFPFFVQWVHGVCRRPP
jgi:ribonuclease Z